MNDINNLTCKFHNPENEAKFLDYDWKTKSRSVRIGLYFLIAILLLNIIPEFFERTSNSNLFGFIVPALFSIVLLRSNDKFMRKYFERFFSVFLAIMIPINQYLNVDIYRQDYDLPAYPIFLAIFILKVLPLSFIWSTPVALITFTTSMLVQDHSKMEPLMYFIYLVVFTFLMYDKWRSELSTIIENMSPKIAVKLLNQYFSRMHDVIEKHDGHILNYIGDSIMIVFGAPNEVDDHELKAVECAVEMRKVLDELNDEWDKVEFSRYWKNHGIDKVEARAGIHSGSVIAGNIGSDRMLQYSAIGDVVNVAARLEQSNKEFGTDICFSHEIYINLKKDLHDSASLSGEIKLKGRSSPLKVYSI